MKYHGVSVYTGDFYKFMVPYVYHNGEWVQAQCFVKIGNEWKIVGGACTQMVYFIDDNGDYVQNDNGGYYLVREPWNTQTFFLRELNDKPLADSNNNDLTV